MENPAVMMVLIFVIVFAFIVLASLLGSFFTINTAERGVVERFNKFSRIANVISFAWSSDMLYSI